MTYPQSTVDKVIAYMNRGHTTYEAAEEFSISHATASIWMRRHTGNRHQRTKHAPRQQHSPKTISLALSLAYGNNNLSITEVASLFGIPSPTISYWKRKYLIEKGMPLPEIDPKDIKHISDEALAKMSEKEKDEYIHKLELKSAVLEGTVKILKAGGIEGASNDEKAALVDALKEKFTVTELLGCVGLTSSSYYYCRHKSHQSDRYTEAREAIKEEFELVKGRRGYRYIRQRLRRRQNPIVISGKTVRRLMAEEGLTVIYYKKKRRYSSYKGEISSAPENLVKRRFHADIPNKLWLTDITEFSLPKGKVYLSPVIDCFDGMPVSWSIGTHPNANLANSMLRKACQSLHKGEHPITHSDRGCHYRWPGWIKICKKYNLTRSMSAKGCSPDNSAMEGFFGRLKNEFFYYFDWDGVSTDEFMKQLDEYMRYYRDERPKESLGWLSPKQYRKSKGLVA